jgi:hypothetical protein
MLMQMVGTVFKRIIARPRGSSTATLDRDLQAANDSELRLDNSQQITL